MGRGFYLVSDTKIYRRFPGLFRYGHLWAKDVALRALNSELGLVSDTNSPLRRHARLFWRHSLRYDRIECLKEGLYNRPAVLFSRHTTVDDRRAVLDHRAANRF